MSSDLYDYMIFSILKSYLRLLSEESDTLIIILLT